MKRSSAFTMIEILIVAAIMAVLSSMLMMALSLAQRQAKATATKSVLMKVDQALRQFRTDMRVYPWQADLGTPPAEPAQWSNNLGNRLAWKPVDAAARLAYASAFQADLAIIRDKFRFINGENVPPTGSGADGTHAFRVEVESSTYRTNLLPAPISKKSATGGNGMAKSGKASQGLAKALTRMAQEITTLRYVAGQMPTEAPVGVDPMDPADLAEHPDEDQRYPSFMVSTSPSIPYRYVPYNKQGHYGDDSRGPVLTAGTASANGWRGDYLTDALRERSIGGGLDASGISIIDAWGNPLIYVCQVSPGALGYTPGYADYGVPAKEIRYNMNPRGRQLTLDLDSDVRTHASAAHMLEFELWSAGADGGFHARRDAAVNRDNISIIGYLRGLR